MGKPNEMAAANTSCYVQVLGVGTDTGCSVPSVLLFFDRQRYLFNAGEGFQRFCVEHHIKLSKLSALLATRVTTEATGGLPGMLITMADTSCGGLLSGHTTMAVHGPQGLNSLVNAFRTFINVKDLGLKVLEFGGTGGELLAPAIKNELVSISPVIIQATPAAGQADAVADADAASNGAAAAPAAPAEEGAEPEAKRPRVAAAAAGMDIASVSVETPAACYVCELPSIPGKFLPQRAAALGVPRGPLYGQLVRGEEVTSISGRVVTPHDVMEPSTPGPVVLVVDCPSAAFLPALTAPSCALHKWTSDEEARSKVACVVHLAPREVLALPEYRHWTGSFHAQATHFLVAESQGSAVPIMDKSTHLHARLSQIDEELFSFPPGVLAASTAAAAARAEAAAGADPPRDAEGGVLTGDNMLRYWLRPVAKRGVDREECGAAVDLEQVRAGTFTTWPEVKKTVEAAKAAAAEDLQRQPPPPAVASATGEELAVTFLGTGAAVPSKYRNVTGILVDMPATGSALLMDCGEGSLGQLVRRLGRDKTDEVLRRLGMVWVSHIHADHHVGLPSLLAARTRLLGADCEPILVVGPRPLRRALTAYATLEPMRFRYVEAAATAPLLEGQAPPPDDVQAAVAAAVAKLGLSRFESVRVVHCAHSYGLIMESTAGAGWKVAFSGDTRPCPALVEAAKGATLFIHEATFDDSMEEEAIAKKHCTTKEAVESGNAAGAYRTVLTHFSQRYPKVPVIDENFGSSVGIAFDLMTVRLTDLPRLPALVPAFKALIDEEEKLKDAEDWEPEPAPAMF